MANNKENNFDDSEEIHLIEKEADDIFLDLIKVRPCLYNKELPEHHDKIIIENAMEEIAFIMQDTVENCECKWKQLKNAYTREKSLQDQENKSGAGASKRNKWIYFDRMDSFMSLRSTSRSSYTNVGKTGSTCHSHQSIGRKKKSNTALNPMQVAFNNVNATLNRMMDDVKNTNSSCQTTGLNDLDILIGKVIRVRLNQLSPASAKRKRKALMKCLIEDSESDSE